MTTIHDLQPETLRLIFSQLTAQQCAQLSTCSKAWQAILADDTLWRGWCKIDWLQTDLKDRFGNTLDTWRIVYATWYSTFGKYSLKMARRTIAAWQAIEGWLAANHQEIYVSLGQPVTEDQLDAAEEHLGYRLPATVRLSYLLHDGQKLECDQSFPQLQPSMSMFHGVPGGYAFYDHVACSRLLTLQQAVYQTCRYRGVIAQDGVAVASALFVKKMFTVQEGGSRMTVSSQDMSQAWDAVPAGGQDALLRWLEAFAQALQQERFGCSKLLSTLPAPVQSINLFSAKEPWQVCEVTRAVKVQASTVFVPELSRRSTHQANTHDFFAYSVAFSLLPVAEQSAVWPATAGPFRPLTCVQLKSRHWIIRTKQDQETEEVQGDGVVGEFPILTPGEEPFVYQSCTHQHGKASMEGSFGFVEGTLSNPAGPIFNVQCPRFLLERPSVIF